MSDREAVFEAIRKDFYDFHLSFFTRWTIVAVGTLSLLVTFVENLKTKILLVGLLEISEIALLTALLLSLYGLYLSTILVEIRHEDRMMQKLSFFIKFSYWGAISHIKWTKALISIIYFIAVCITLYFINSNL